MKAKCKPIQNQIKKAMRKIKKAKALLRKMPNDEGYFVKVNRLIMGDALKAESFLDEAEQILKDE